MSEHGSDFPGVTVTEVSGKAPDPDDLGRLVREVWVEWAREQPDVAEHPSWVKPYGELSDRDKDVDRRIGERLFLLGFAWQPGRGVR